MKVMLDTHCLLWWAMDDANLSSQVKNIISDPEVDVFISTASVWEICIKYRKGKLDLPKEPEKIIKDLVEESGFQCIPIHNRHCYQETQLPMIHGDPFDRMIIAQSLVENLTLLSKDQEIREYPVTTIW
jgi:PIN domain nuclease of toxin-antitoxin system